MLIKYCMGTLIVLLIYTTLTFAVEPPNASDMMGQIRSFMSLDFKQADAIKPYVNDYVTAFKLIQDRYESDPNVFFIQIVKINADLDLRFSKILNPNQMRIWKQTKRSILPEVRSAS